MFSTIIFYHIITIIFSLLILEEKHIVFHTNQKLIILYVYPLIATGNSLRNCRSFGTANHQP